VSFVLLITNIPTPYRVPLFNAINRGLARQGRALYVLYGGERDASRLWNVDLAESQFEYEFSAGRPFRYARRSPTTFAYPGLARRIRRLDPDLVVVGGFGPGALKIWANSLVDERPYVVWSGAVGHDGLPGWIRVPQRRLVLSRAAGSIAYGAAAKEYLVSLGQDEKKIHVALNTVDTEFFSRRDRPTGMNDPFTFVSVGDLVVGKRIDLAIDAVAALARVRRDFKLRIVGDGPMRTALEQQCHGLGVDDLVEFCGYLDKFAVRDALGSADCLLFPSEIDIWGLVINEAMAMGLPSIASVKSGATRDLVFDGRTGFAVDFSDTAFVAQRMRCLVDNRATARAMGASARRCVTQRASLASTAEAWIDAIDAFAPGSSLVRPGPP
jgi:glycosyltransferase involved in cell wall biosynthesis